MLTTQEDKLRAIWGSSNIFKSPSTKLNCPDLNGDLILKSKVKHHHEAGLEAMSKSQFGEAVRCFSKAINLTPDQAQLYVDRAEAYLQLCDFQSAALSYREACLLEPQTKPFTHRLAFIYYLQGQCLYDLGMVLSALESFTKAAELKPNYRPYHLRSIACLTALGRYSDSLRLISTWLESDSQSADLFTLRARLHRQLNQVSLCYRDLRAALRLKPSCPEALSLLRQQEEDAERAYQRAVNKAVEGELSDALVKINNALDYNPEPVRYYLFRGILYRRLKDFTPAIDDLVFAMELRDAGKQSPYEEQREGGEQPPNEEQREDGEQPPNEEQREDGEQPPNEEQREDGEQPPNEEQREDGEQPPNEEHREDGEQPPNEEQREDGEQPPNEEQGEDGEQPPNEEQREDGEQPPNEEQREDGEQPPNEEQREDGEQPPNEEQREDGEQPPNEEQREDDSEDLRDEIQAQLVLTYNDFAVDCFSHGFYNEAARLLGKAIQEQRQESRLFINRGDCFFQLSEWDFALADYQQAEEMDAHDPGVTVRLAAVHNARGQQSHEDGKHQEAVERFSVAIKYNPAVSQYYGNRANAQWRVPNMEQARQDAIRALLLDQKNDQVVPLLLSLFPGCSITDIMSSDCVQVLRTQLLESMQANKCTSWCDKEFLPHDSGSQSEEPQLSSEEETEGELKVCVSQQTLPRELVRSKQRVRAQVNQAVRQALHHRQSLQHMGPRLTPVSRPHHEEPARRPKERPYLWRQFSGLGLNC